MIDALTAADAAAAAGLSAAFGWPHRPADWAIFLRIGRGFAWREDGALLGTALWFPLGPAHGSIGGVQVAPQLQGRGIGRRLMDAVLDDAAPRSLRLHATPEGAGLYAKLGFRPAGTVRQWQGVCRVEARASPRVRDASPADRPAITACDAAARTARDEVLAAWLQDAAVAVHGAPVTGYGVRRDFGRGQLIGPLVAAEEAAAIELVQALATPGFLRIDIPDTARDLAAWLAAAGLAPVDDALQMQRGSWPQPAAMRIWAPATQAMG